MKRNLHPWMACLAAAAMLVACGGGDDPPPPGPLERVPESASASATGLVSYLKALVEAVVAGDSAEPVALDNFEPPRPEDTEPEPVT